MWSSTIVNFLHVAATALWIGGMVFMAAVFVPVHHLAEPAQRGRLMGAAAKRFTVIAWSSATVLLVTGLIRMPSDTLMRFGSTYETLLSIKLILFFLMVIFGLTISLILVPMLGKLAPGPGDGPNPEFIKVQNRLESLSKTNLILGIGILIVISVIAS